MIPKFCKLSADYHHATSFMSARWINFFQKIRLVEYPLFPQYDVFWQNLEILTTRLDVCLFSPLVWCFLHQIWCAKVFFISTFEMHFFSVCCILKYDKADTLCRKPHRYNKKQQQKLEKTACTSIFGILWIWSYLCWCRNTFSSIKIEFNWGPLHP